MQLFENTDDSICSQLFLKEDATMAIKFIVPVNKTSLYEHSLLMLLTIQSSDQCNDHT